MSAFRLNRKAFIQVARRLLGLKKIARIHGKFYVVVPLEHAAVGVIPADWFIGKLMEHLRRPFYVGAQCGGMSRSGASASAMVSSGNGSAVPGHLVQGRRDSFPCEARRQGTPIQQIKVVTGYIPVSTPRQPRSI